MGDAARLPGDPQGSPPSAPANSSAEIGLLQNSGPNASVTAHQNTRCLSIPRTELLRFVTHNYTVALELERVSSQRLGRPIFPLRQGDFRTI